MGIYPYAHIARHRFSFVYLYNKGFSCNLDVVACVDLVDRTSKIGIMDLLLIIIPFWVCIVTLTINYKENCDVRLINQHPRLRLLSFFVSRVCSYFAPVSAGLPLAGLLPRT